MALTGTPGVGKTRVARELRRSGFFVVDGKLLARRSGAIVGWDRRRRSSIVDLRRVGRALRTLRVRGEAVGIVESHWAHEVPGVEAAIVLRCRPRVLEARLRARGWSRAKIRENAEAEALHLILHESLEKLGARRVGELDATRRTPTSAARVLRRVLQDPRRRLMNLEIGRHDWTADILGWY